MNEEKQKFVCRGEVYLASLPNTGNNSVQRGSRPVVIVSNYKNNLFSPNVTVLPITTHRKKRLPTHVDLSCFDSVFKTTGTVLCEQILTVGKKNLTHYIGKLSSVTMEKISASLKIQLEL